MFVVSKSSDYTKILSKEAGWSAVIKSLIFPNLFLLRRNFRVLRTEFNLNLSRHCVDKFRLHHRRVVYDMEVKIH